MTLAELKNILDATGYPVAYSHFTKEVPGIPFITYVVESSANFIADNKVYQKINDARIELYTEIKDLQAESALETLLDDHEIPWDADEVWIDSEKLYQRIYEIGVI